MMNDRTPYETHTAGEGSPTGSPSVRVFGLGGLLFSLLALLGVAQVSAVTIRSKADMRLWETVSDRASPLSWPWMTGADSATIVFSNRVTHAVSSFDVARTLGEQRGSCAQPAEAQSGETIVDATLVQTSSGNELARERATLAYVSGAGGGPVVVRAAAARGWRHFAAPRVFAFDPVWFGEAGDSGYDISWPDFVGLMMHIR